LLEIVMVWPELALSMMPPADPAVEKFTALPLMLKDCALDVKFQALGAIVLPTTTDVNPPAPNDALWPDVVGRDRRFPFRLLRMGNARFAGNFPAKA
jgi:hypothetical protein